jgi:hypothetical protein
LSPPSWAIPARILTQTQTNVNVVERDGRSFTGTALTYGVSMPAGRVSFVKLPGLPNAVQPASEYCYLALCALRHIFGASAIVSKGHAMRWHNARV